MKLGLCYSNEDLKQLLRVNKSSNHGTFKDEIEDKSNIHMMGRHRNVMRKIERNLDSAWNILDHFEIR